MENENDAVEQVVIVHITLSDTGYGSASERQTVADLEVGIEAAIVEADAGEFDGNEFGGGEAVLYAYGPDRDRLWAAIEPVLRAFPLRPACALVGAAGASESHQRREL